MRKIKSYVGLIIAMILAMSLLFTGCGDSQSSAPAQSQPAQETVLQTEAADAPEETEDLIEDETAPVIEMVYYYFRNDRLLQQHYEKHGIEMGFDSPEDYSTLR